MSFASWLKSKKTNAKRVPVRRHAFQPALERLEGRLTPAAVITVNSILDTNASDGILTLREAILVNNRTLAFATLTAAEQAQVSGTPTAVDTDTVNFNIPGVGVQTIKPLTPLPAITDSVVIDGYSQPESSVNTDSNGFNAVLGIELNGGSAGFTGASIGLWFKVGGNTVRGLVINRFFAQGILLEATNLDGHNVIQGNILGTNTAGTLTVGNGGANLQVMDSNNLIGGTTPAARNLISGKSSLNATSGIVVGGNSATPVFGNNVIVGNFIGTNSAGIGAVGQDTGIRIQGGAQETRVGGTTVAERNIISGNFNQGVYIFSAYHQIVQGNYMGTDVAGAVAIASGPTTASPGIEIWGPNNSLIGGTTPGAGNLISGNDGNGISFGPNAQDGRGVVIQGNRIGLSASGAPLGNQREGIAVGTATDTLVGGATAGAGNLIAYNGGNGILVAGVLVAGSGDTSILIQGNEIRNNVVDGVQVRPGPTGLRLIGGRNPGEGNVITANGRVGVFIQSSMRTEVAGNSIYANGALGIDLQAAGLLTIPVPNDLNDADGGANLLQNYPVLTVAQGGPTTHIEGTLNSVAGMSYKLDFYASAAADPSGFGEGQRYLGFTTVSTPVGGNDVSFTVTLPAATAAGEFVTATATDFNNNTSEFSEGRIVIQANQPPVANDDSANMTEDDASVGGNVLTNDTDADAGTTLTVANPGSFSGTYGLLTLNNDGSYSYALNTTGVQHLAPGASLTDSFSYQASDSVASSNNATLVITITGVNDAPVANDDSASMTEDDASVSGNVLSNDTDVDDGTTLVVASPGTFAGVYGSLTLNSDGGYSYALNTAGLQHLAQGASVTDSFSYQASDGLVSSNNATLVITITGVNDAPVITSNGGGDTAAQSVPENTTAVTTVTAVDLDAGATKSFAISGGADASRFAIDPSTGALRFITAPNFEAPADAGADNVYEVQVQVSDGALTDTQTITVTVADVVEDQPPVYIGQGCCDPTALVVQGTEGNDKIRIIPEGCGGDIKVLLNGTAYFFAAGSFTSIAVFGKGGDDRIVVAGAIDKPACLFGGDGNDCLQGGAGDDVVIGGAGDDLLIGRRGRDLLIGGAGADRIVGNADDDILIAGTTDYDGNQEALCAIMAEWTRCDLGYAQRVAHLRQGGGRNGGVTLTDATVHDDGCADRLTGSAGRDWYFANLDCGVRDCVTDEHNNEFVADLD